MNTTIWRISHKKHAASAFSGVGTRLSSGRCNSKGTSLVYASATLSLAALETFFPIELEQAGDLFVSIRVDIPDRLLMEKLEPRQLPSNWRNIPAPRLLASIGDRWFRLGRAPVLIVPSAIVPEENNYLLNTFHRDFEEITIYPPQPFVLERRRLEVVSYEL